MPYRPKRPCRQSSCPELTDDASGYCPAHRTLYYREQDSLRGGSTERGYNYRWRIRRDAYLKMNPLCIECLKDGRTTAATEVDHIMPHRGDMKLFWDEDNWQPLCEYHHKSKTAKEKIEGEGGSKS